MPVCTFSAHNTNDMMIPIYGMSDELFKHYTYEADTRNGRAYVFRGPVAMTYTKPYERVNYCPIRDANPFFHLWESLAMLGGYNSVPFLSWFVPRMRNYSDDGRTFHGFYGTRLTATPNQLHTAVEMLRFDPSSRRVVLSIWDSIEDLDGQSNDVPCNDMIFLNAQRGVLDMLVAVRSNDLVWGGVSGANPVQFAFFLEYIARAAELPAGELTFIVSNAHFYDTAQFAQLRDHYQSATLPAVDYCATATEPLHDADGVAKLRVFDRELRRTLEHVHQCINTGSVTKWIPHNTFLASTALPMFNAYMYYRRGDLDMARNVLEHCVAEDWRLAGDAWLERRQEARR